MTHSGMRRGTGPGLQETPGRFGLCCLQRPLEPQTGSAGQWSPELSLHPPLYYRLFTIFMPPPPYGCGSLHSGAAGNGAKNRQNLGSELHDCVEIPPPARARILTP